MEIISPKREKNQRAEEIKKKNLIKILFRWKRER